MVCALRGRANGQHAAHTPFSPAPTRPPWRVGQEFERSSTRLDLRFVPAEQSFEGRIVRDAATSVRHHILLATPPWHGGLLGTRI